MMHEVGLALSLLLVAIGLLLGVRNAVRGHAARREVARGLDRLMKKQPRAALHVDAKQLGRGTRFMARILRSSYRPADVDFDFIEAYTRDVDVRRLVVVTPGITWVSSAAAAAAPFAELEHLVEVLDSFSARVRSWRPGRRRERS